MTVASYARAMTSAICAARVVHKPRGVRVATRKGPNSKTPVTRCLSWRQPCSSSTSRCSVSGLTVCTSKAIHHRDVRVFASEIRSTVGPSSEDKGDDIDGVSGETKDDASSKKTQSYSSKTKSLMSQLQSYGMAGMTCYGILNTLYYTCAFSIAWSFRTIPANLATGPAFKLAGECMALVWAGSQVTKLARLGLAVAGAPKIDTVIKRICEKTGWKYENVFFTTVFGCLAGTAALFSVLILAKAALA